MFATPAIWERCDGHGWPSTRTATRTRFGNVPSRRGPETAAAIDRLVHHSVIVELNVPSYRLETAKGVKATATPESEPAATQ